jgi:signal transduction histidine kinase
MEHRSAALVHRPWVVATIAGLLVWAIWAVGAMAMLERPVGDLVLRLPRPIAVQPAPVAAVVIDESSLARVGPLPWRRSVLAALIQLIRSRGARTVVVDILLADETRPEEDDALAAALAGGPAVLAAVLAPHAGWILPLEQFGGVTETAHAHAEVGPDGVVRSMAATKQARGASMPALSIAAARHAGWSGAVPVGRMLHPDFRQPPDSIPAVSAGTVLDGSLDPRAFEDLVVFVGMTASGTGDQFVIPVGPRDRPTPGVLVHASATASIFRGGLLRSPTAPTVLVLMLAVSLVTQLIRSIAGRLAVGRLAALSALLAAAAVLTLWWIDTQLPLASLLLVLWVSAAGREAMESIETQREAGAVLASLLETGPEGVHRHTPAGASERLRLARALQQQVARDAALRAVLLEGLREGVVLWDSSGRALVANDAIHKMWGTVPTLGEVAAMTGDSSADGSEVSGEFEREGRVFEIEIRPVAAGTLGLLRDVTAARQLERNRREVQRMVSHELKTPLSSISGFGAMIERYELSRPEQLRVAGLIRGEADRLGDMVRSFLDLERLGSGRWEADRVEVDLGELAARRCELLKTNAAQSGHRMIGTTNSMPVLGAEDLLTRLIDNLIGNALTHTPAGTEVRVTAAANDRAAELTVSDDGPGIDPAVLSRLFDRFVRGPGTSAGGSGLGLALVREIATWHGATVTVETQPGQGSTFTVRFPSGGAARSDNGS